MKKTIEVELLSDAVNAPVIKMPGRRYPGVLVQGDSLSILYDTVEEVEEAFSSGNADELRGLIAELKAALCGKMKVYENALAEEGVDLPYYVKE